ncbi:MAG: PDZ domain-containing protein, partial [Rikenellaceae bacterium]|nr:PDZ domain-containing protein [Rikenellaceae bacterium]
MKHWYLWSDSIPQYFSKTYYTKNADEYFESLLYKRNDTYGDRFSYIEKKSAAQSKASLPVKTGFGFEFKYLRSSLHSGGNEPVKIYLYVVYYVHPNSPAEKAGLKRGDLIYKVNGEYINDMNALNSKTNITVKLANFENFYLVFRENDPTRDISIGEYTDSPILADIILSNNSKKVGYLCYRTFSEGSDQYLIESFKRYKAEGVSELILDLRYNQGGRLSIAQTLGGLLIPTDKLGLDYIRQEPNQTIKNSKEVNLTLKTPKNQ